MSQAGRYSAFILKVLAFNAAVNLNKSFLSRKKQRKRKFFVRNSERSPHLHGQEINMAVSSINNKHCSTFYL